MMDRQETIADLIAWLRRPREGENAYLTLWRDEIADRLEAVHKRERGDAAKLREALRECAQYIACVGGIGVGEVTINDNVHLIPEELTQKAIAALSAPPRNCDLPEVAKDPWRAWLDDKSNWDEFGSPKLEIHDWLLAPATEQEGGAK